MPVDDTRRRILDVTWRLFSRDAAGTRMEDVARAAGISRQALYLHFTDRASLLVAAVAYGDELLGLDEATRPIRDATTGLEALDRIARFYGDYLPRVADVVLEIEGAALRDDAVSAAVEDRQQNRLKGARSVVSLLVRDGVLSPDLDPEEAASLLTVIGSVQVWAELTRVHRWSKRRYVEHLRRLLRLTLLAPNKKAPRSAR